MLNEHTEVGIAQVVLYAPAVPVILYLNIRHGFQRSRGWLFLLIFSTMRLTGGILVIVLQQNPNSIGLIIASTILLGVGVPPLLFATMRFIATACAVGFENIPLLPRILKGGRVLFFVALALLITGGTFVGFPSLINAGQKLLQAAYIVLAVLLIFITGFNIYLWRNQAQLTTVGATIVKGTSLSVPFLAIRMAYAFLSAFNLGDVEWEPLYGSVAAFVGMALVQEYIVLVFYFYVGIRTPRSRNMMNPQGDDRSDSLQTSAEERDDLKK